MRVLNVVACNHQVMYFGEIGTLKLPIEALVEIVLAGTPFRRNRTATLADRHFTLLLLTQLLDRFIG